MVPTYSLVLAVLPLWVSIAEPFYWLVERMLPTCIRTLATQGPALFLAYGVAAISAFLSSFCYSEFTVTMPLAGASYNYTCVCASLLQNLFG